MSKNLRMAIPCLGLLALTLAVIAILPVKFDPLAPVSDLGRNREGYFYIPSEAPPLWEAIEEGDLDLAEQLLDQGEDPNEQFKERNCMCTYKTSILERVIEKGDIDMFLLLERRGAVIRSEEMDTAVKQDRLELVRYMVEFRGIQPDFDYHYNHPLLTALTKKNEAMVKVLEDRCKWEDEMFALSVAYKIDRCGEDAYVLLKKHGALENPKVRDQAYRESCGEGLEHLRMELLALDPTLDERFPSTSRRTPQKDNA